MDTIVLLVVFFILCFFVAWVLNYIAHPLWLLKEWWFKTTAVMLTALSLAFVGMPFVALGQELGLF